MRDREVNLIPLEIKGDCEVRWRGFFLGFLLCTDPRHHRQGFFSCQPVLHLLTSTRERERARLERTRLHLASHVSRLTVVAEREHGESTVGRKNKRQRGETRERTKSRRRFANGWEDEGSLTESNRETNTKYYTKSALLEINGCNRFRKFFAETVAKSWFAQKHHSCINYDRLSCDS